MNKREARINLQDATIELYPHKTKMPNYFDSELPLRDEEGLEGGDEVLPEISNVYVTLVPNLVVVEHVLGSVSNRGAQLVHELERDIGNKFI